jgi:hypothetical protein
MPITKNYTQLSQELSNLEGMTDFLWNLKESGGDVDPDYMQNFDYEFSEGLSTSFRELGKIGLYSYSSKEDLLEDIIDLSRTPTPIFTSEDEDFSFAEGGEGLKPEIIVSLLKKILASVYTGDSKNVQGLLSVDGEPLSEENQFGYDSADGKIKGMFLGSGDDPIRYELDEKGIRYGTEENYPGYKPKRD